MVAGIGQRDVTPDDVVNMVNQAVSEKPSGYPLYGVRG
jgi:hypothetical protein